MPSISLLLPGVLVKLGRRPYFIHALILNTFIQTTLEKRGHNVSRVDPIDFPLLDKPYFGYAKGNAPVHLEEVHSVLSSAHCYVCVTPEYNHSPSPGLLNVLNHFGSSTFSFKPSAIGKQLTFVHHLHGKMTYLTCLVQWLILQVNGEGLEQIYSERVGMSASIGNDSYSKSSV